MLKTGQVTAANPSLVHSLYYAKHRSVPMQVLEEKLEYWVDKHKNDTDAKDKELDALKASKANNWDMLQSLANEVRHQQRPCKAAPWLFPTLIKRRNQDHGKKNQ